MATFTQWVKAQADRDDSVGYFAKYWEQVTPGKISSIAGVGRLLDQLAADFAVQPEEMAEPAWRSAQAKIGAAQAGYELAVREYHNAESIRHDARAIRDQAAARTAPPEPEQGQVTAETGLHEQVSDFAPEPRTHSGAAGLSGQGELTGRAALEKPVIAPHPQRAGAYTGWPEERFNRLEANQARLLEAQARLIEVIGSLVRQQGELIERLAPEEPIDWDAKWREAAGHERARQVRASRR
jgi:hypothetical protein